MASRSETPAGRPGVVAATVVDLARSRPATLGVGRLVCVDGPAGSGKTTLAAAVAAITGAQVVHMDDLMHGWEHATDTTAQLRGLLQPMADSRPGRYEEWDWHQDRVSREVSVPAAPWLVVEGVGSGNPEVAPLVTVLVWVEADDDLRLTRGLERDGVAMREHWLGFMRDEALMFAEHRTRERADVLVDGTGAAAPVLRDLR
ncbi:uridine kinase family protein [Nocardioides nanhaiensis]|uniref:ATPase AAA-type core domain-containing protein n=1 Tax=Nocardioides nanhaiensis TaxID=1476871 RepID=A0ABP8X5H1_9ACTN